MNHCTFLVILRCRRGLTENAQNYGQIRSAQHSAGGRQTGCFDCIVHIWQQNSNNFGRWSSEWSSNVALSFYLNRIEWQNKVFFNLNNVWNASPAIEGSIREFWLDAEIKIGKELNYLGTIILMICPQSLIAFIQLDRAPPYKQLHIPDTLRLNPFLPLQQNEVVSEASVLGPGWLADTDSCLEPEVAWLMSIMMVTFYPFLIERK